MVMGYIQFRCQRRISKMKERRNIYTIDIHSIFLDINFFKFMSSVGDESLSFENKKPSSIGVSHLIIIQSIILVVLTLAGIAGFTAYAIISSEDSNSILLETVYNQNVVLDTYWNEKFNNSLAKRVRVKVRMDSDNELTVKIGNAD